MNKVNKTKFHTERQQRDWNLWTKNIANTLETDMFYKGFLIGLRELLVKEHLGIFDVRLIESTGWCQLKNTGEYTKYYYVQLPKNTYHLIRSTYTITPKEYFIRKLQGYE